MSVKFKNKPNDRLFVFPVVVKNVHTICKSDRKCFRIRIKISLFYLKNFVTEYLLETVSPFILVEYQDQMVNVDIINRHLTWDFKA